MMPIVITKQRRYIRQFKKLEAIFPGTAIKPEEYGISKSIAFKKLLQQKIIIHTYEDHFYLDVLRADEMRTRRRVTVLFLFIIIFSVLIISLILIDYFTGDRLLMIGHGDMREREEYFYIFLIDAWQVHFRHCPYLM